MPAHRTILAKCVIVLLLLAFGGHAQASRESILAFSSFRLESAGIGSSGKVIVSGQQDEKSRLTALKVEAFGKTFDVPKENLAGLSELSSNGVRISYVHGDTDFGGRTIYIQLEMGFTSGTKKQALITINENGTIRVGKIEHK